jgi:glucose/arabinose dehydrogenase
MPSSYSNLFQCRLVMQLSADGSKLFVSVGSATNVGRESPDSGRACILRINLDGSGREIFASGLRNAVGMAVHPTTGELYTAVNERDERACAWASLDA